MAYEVKKINEVKVEVITNFEGEVVKKAKKKIIKEIAEKAEIKGFRKGKVPVAVVEEKFAKDIEQSIVETLINSEYPEIIKKEGIKPVTYPSITDVKIDGDKAEIKLMVEIYPEVKVGEYKGLEIEKEKYEMKDDDLGKELDSLVDRNSKLEEAAEGKEAAEGDTADINFEGFVDGEAFEGGKAENHLLKLGSKSFIGDFEEQIQGHKAGDEFEVNVVFPEAYAKEDLAGKSAMFKVKVNAIKVMKKPELNDEFAKEVGYDTFEDLKEAKKIEVQKREEGRIEKGFINNILEKIKEGSELIIPDALINRESNQRMAEMENQLKSQGMSLEMYLKMSNITEEKMLEDLKPIAEEKVKMDLILEEIARVEDVQITEEEIEEKIAEVAKYYRMEVEKLKAELKKAGNYDNFIESLKFEKITQKTVELIVSETITV